jgi:hypothetical protein
MALSCHDPNVTGQTQGLPSVFPLAGRRKNQTAGREPVRA